MDSHLQKYTEPVIGNNLYKTFNKKDKHRTVSKRNTIKNYSFSKKK